MQSHTNDKRAALLEGLGREVEKLTSSERWTEWLQIAARFHKYSLNNQLLILSQRPSATRVAGYRAWSEMGRQVKKGEKGIAILAPSIRKAENPDTGETAPVVVGFRVVHVFDIAQTDGDPLAELEMPSVVVPDTSLYSELVEIAHGLGFQVASVPTSPNGARGWWDPEKRTITIVAENSVESRCRTMLHELAHAFDTDAAAGWDRETRAERELVAESAAYIVGTGLGIDMRDASSFYVATWGGQPERLAEIAAKILTVAGKLTDAVTPATSELAVA